MWETQLLCLVVLRGERRRGEEEPGEDEASRLIILSACLLTLEVHGLWKEGRGAPLILSAVPTVCSCV